MDKNNFRTRVTPKKKKTNIMVDEDIWERFKYFVRLKKISISDYTMQIVIKELNDKKDELKKLDYERKKRLKII